MWLHGKLKAQVIHLTSKLHDSVAKVLVIFRFNFVVIVEINTTATMPTIVQLCVCFTVSESNRFCIVIVRTLDNIVLVDEDSGLAYWMFRWLGLLSVAGLSTVGVVRYGGWGSTKLCGEQEIIDSGFIKAIIMHLQSDCRRLVGTWSTTSVMICMAAMMMMSDRN